MFTGLSTYSEAPTPTTFATLPSLAASSGDLSLSTGAYAGGNTDAFGGSNPDPTSTTSSPTATSGFNNEGFTTSTSIYGTPAPDATKTEASYADEQCSTVGSKAIEAWEMIEELADISDAEGLQKLLEDFRGAVLNHNGSAMSLATDELLEAPVGSAMGYGPYEKEQIKQKLGGFASCMRSNDTGSRD